MRTSTDSNWAIRQISSKPSHPPVSVPQGPLAMIILIPLVSTSEAATSGHGNLGGRRIFWTARYDPEAFTPRTPIIWPGKRDAEGTAERLSGTRAPPPRRRDVSRTRLVRVGLAVVVGGSKQIRPTATISFYPVNKEW
jgi:hypothetical protein